MRQLIWTLVICLAAGAASIGPVAAVIVENFDDWHGFETAYISDLAIDTANKMEGAASLYGLANTGENGYFATTIQTSQDLNVNAAGTSLSAVWMYFSDVSAIKSDQVSLWLYSGTPWSGNNIRWLLSGAQAGWNHWVVPFSAAFSTSGAFDPSDTANYQVQVYGNGTVAEYDYRIDGLELLVPEPGSFAALGMGLVGLLGFARRMRR